MDSSPILALLLFDIILGSILIFRGGRGQKDSILLATLFFCSGMPALIYQIVWQRALFAIYGVNSQSVAVVVTSFMIGLGVGYLIGGWISERFPDKGIVIFGLAELGVACFGFSSLTIFHWMAARTAGATLPFVILFSLLLLLLPTMLMGATLPLLVEHLVSKTGNVGFSVSTLYFVNTLGSAVACYLCATFLLRDLGQKHSLGVAASLNILVGASAYLYSRSGQQNASETTGDNGTASQLPEPALLPLNIAMFLAGLSGFVALGFELAWFRVYALAASDRAPAFALLLATYLGGVAAGSCLSEKWSDRRKNDAGLIYLIGGLLLAAGVLSQYIPPLVSWLMARNLPFSYSAPACFVAAAAIGSILPLLCQLGVSADTSAGRRVSLVYLSNILGSAFGCLAIGFVVMDYLGLQQVTQGLGTTVILLGAIVFLFAKPKLSVPPGWAIAAIVLSLLTVPASSRFYSQIFDHLVFGSRHTSGFVRIVENRNGVIGVTHNGAVFGGGVYDGFFNVDPLNDTNMIVRIYLLSSFCPAPRHVLVIGLSSGSWVQVIANHPQLESMDVVEINPGYLKLIPEYPAVQSIIHNPKVTINVDDGRRWLLAHPQARYDAIISNTTYHWRDHSSNLLSAEFLAIIRAHLNPKGVYYFNTTGSDEAIATALDVFPYGLRVVNFLAVSDWPIVPDADRLLDALRQYTLDGRTMFDPVNPLAEQAISEYSALVGSVNRPPVFFGLESSNSLRRRLGHRLIITDDNMGLEWSKVADISWH